MKVYFSKLNFRLRIGSGDFNQYRILVISLLILKMIFIVIFLSALYLQLCH